MDGGFAKKNKNGGVYRDSASELRGPWWMVGCSNNYVFYIFYLTARFSYCFSNNSRIFPNIIRYFMSGQSIELASPCCKLSHRCHPTTGQYVPLATRHLPSFPCCLSSSSCVATLSCPEDLVLYTCASTIPAHLDARCRQSF
jgi:hypothetical protein